MTDKSAKGPAGTVVNEPRIAIAIRSIALLEEAQIDGGVLARAEILRKAADRDERLAEIGAMGWGMASLL